MLKPFATKLDEAVLKQLDELARKTRIPKSRLCHQAIEMLVGHYEEQGRKLALGERLYQEEAPLVGTGAGSAGGEKSF